LRISFIAIGCLAAVLVVGAQLRGARLPVASAAPLRALCGSERWSVKTLSDADSSRVELTKRPRTIAQLNALPEPSSLPASGRVAAELQVYKVTYVSNEDDGDIHLALQGSDGSTLIAEAPAVTCDLNARDRRAINAARLAAQTTQVGDKVVAAGVGFFDFPHGQNGRAKNNIELHPLISLRPAIAVPLTTNRHSAAGVRLIHVTSPISAGSQATLTASVTPNATCSITVNYKSGPSHAAGLYPTRSTNHRVSWTWMVGTRTTPGRWTIDVRCGSAGSLDTSFVTT
jgi:hypothetical protein